MINNLERDVKLNNNNNNNNKHNQVNIMNDCLYVTTPCECDMMQKINMVMLQRFALLLLCDQVHDVEAIYCLSILLTASGNHL